MDGSDAQLDTDAPGLGSHVSGALDARKIASTPSEHERLVRWLVGAQAACTPWAGVPEAGPADFDRALREASGDR